VRIVSLLPSTTEVLFAIGAGDDVVGVTFECDFPPQARERRVVSTSALTPGMTPGEIDAAVRASIAAGDDLYRLDADALRDLDPDLVLTQDLCAVCAVDVASVDAAMNHLGCTGSVLTVDPSTLADVLTSVATIGAATGRAAAAGELVAALRARLAQVASDVAGRPSPRVVVLEWTDPPFSAGHWVPDMVAAAGALPVLGQAGERSVEVGWADVAAARPDLVVVAPCGFHLADATDLAAGLVRAGQLPVDCPVWAVDADAAFVRPGPRLVDGIEALSAICHPDRRDPRPDIARRVAMAAVPRATSPSETF
jgi:iron complex transport system substrate-binding protein